MSQPTRSDVHVSRPLTNISIAYVQNAQDFIADKVFPNVPVQKQADKYFSYVKDYWFTTGAKKRPPGSESAGGGFEINSDNTYFADVWAFHMDVDDQTRANADDPINLDRDATNFVTRNLLLRRELSFTQRFMQPGIWMGNGGTDFAPTNLWSAANSNPIGDIDTLSSRIKSATGLRPNTLVVSDDVYNALKNNASIIDRIKYTQRGVVTQDLLAAIFGVDNFYVSSVVLNSAKEGSPFAPAFINHGQFLLCYSNPTPSIMTPSAGYTFSWTGLFGTGAAGNRIKTFRMEHLESDRVEGEMAYDMKLIGADLGVFGNAVI